MFVHKDKVKFDYIYMYLQFHYFIFQGVRIYGMQVGYRSDFYRQVSKMTNGAHLRLDSANLTHDMLMAVCLREGNLKLLKVK